MPRRVYCKEGAPQVFKVSPVKAEIAGEGILICCIVNNIQNIQLTMPPNVPHASTEVTVMKDIQHKPLINGRMEIECVFFTPADATKIRAGRLVIDDRHVMELGPLLKEQPVQCATLVDAIPVKLRLEVDVVDKPAVHPSETLLMRHCLAILQNDEYLGSVSSSHLQNQVRDLPFYKDVIGPIKKNWTEFIRQHTDQWDVFKYSQEEIESAEIGTTCRAKEYRIVARTLLEDYREGDVARERIRVSAERQLHDMLVKKLREREYEQSELLKELVKEKCFLTLITPNLSKMLDMFEREPNKYFVLRDRLHPVLVEMKKGGIVDDPKFDLWDNTPPPKYSFDYPDYEG